MRVEGSKLFSNFSFTSKRKIVDKYLSIIINNFFCWSILLINIAIWFFSHFFFSLFLLCCIFFFFFFFFLLSYSSSFCKVAPFVVGSSDSITTTTNFFSSFPSSFSSLCRKLRIDGREKLSYGLLGEKRWRSLETTR